MAREHRLGGGVGALGAAVHHRRGADEGHEARRVVGGAAGELVALGVPGLDDVGVGGAARTQAFAVARRSAGGTTSSIRPACLRGGGGEHLAFEQEGGGGHEAQHADEAGGAAGAGEDAEEDLGEADARPSACRP